MLTSARPILLALLWLLCASCAVAEEPDIRTNRPQYERMLTGETARQANVLERRIRDLAARNQYPEAIKFAEEVLELRTGAQGSDHWQVHDARYQLSELRRSPLSSRQFQQLEEGRQLNARATALHRQSKDQEALIPAEAALKICRGVWGDKHTVVATCLNNVAQIHAGLGAYSKAEPLHREALEMQTELLGEMHPLTIVGLNNLALLYQSQGAYAKAEPLHIEALRRSLWVLGTRDSLTATCFNNLALVSKLQGAYARAEAPYLDALRIYRETAGESHPDTASALNNLASLYQSQGRFPQAEACYLESLRICRATLGENHADTAGTLSDLASLYESQGKFDRAEPLQEEAMRIRLVTRGPKHPSTANGLNSLAILYKRKGAYDQAERLYERSLSIYLQTLGEKHPSTANGRRNLAVLYQSQRKFDKAEPLLLEAIRVYRETLGDKHHSTAGSLYNLARLYEVQGKYAEAETVLAEVAAAYEANRLIAAFGIDRAIVEDAHSPYPLQAANFAAQRKPRDAWRSLEFDLARGLLDEQLARRGFALSSDEREQRGTLVEEFGIVQKRILKLATATNLSEAESGELAGLLADRTQLDDKFGGLAVSVSKREIAGLDEIQSSLRDEEALVAWIDVGGQLQEHWACLLRHEGEPHWERLSGTGKNGQWTDEDTALPDKLRKALASAASSRSAIRSLAQMLRSQRLAPLGMQLQGVKALHVVSVGEMTGIPIETLTDEYAIGYVPSGTFIARLKDQGRKPTSGILALGDPVFDAGSSALPSPTEPLASSDGDKSALLKTIASLRGGQWKELPGTRAELRQICGLFGVNMTTLLDEKASEQSLEKLRRRGELATFRYLHFATHGEANNVQAFDSALILAQDDLPKNALPRPGAPYIDGKLTAGEVLDYWKLNAELVTLSACETAIGRDGGGDGMLGFAQAFLTAGAHSVCLSLWKVDDTATALLMQRFYQNLLGKRPGLDKPLGKAVALDEAKRWLRELSSEDAQKLTAELGKGVSRTRGKGEELKLVVPAADSSSPDKESDKPFSHPRYWAAFILIGDPR